jgi:hypothetical protein
MQRADDHEEIPRPLGECCVCKTPIFDERHAITDSEGDHYCLICGPERGDS